MINLKFYPFLPLQDKPESFEKFRQIASEVYKDLNGNLTFMFLEVSNQFEIKENTTEKSDLEIKNMLDANSNFLI